MHVVAEAAAEHVLAVQLSLHVEVERINHFGAEPGEFAERALEHRHNGRIRVLRVDQGAEHPDARALQAVRVEEAGVIVLPAAAPGLGVRVCGIVAGHDVEDARHVVDGAAHGSGDVPIEGERNHPVAAGEPDGRADADERQPRGRAADRIAGVAAQPDETEVGRDAGRGSAARARRDAVERVGVARRVEGRTDRLARAEGPFGHVRLGNHDRTRLADAAHHERVVGGDARGERDRARRGDHVVRVEVVLDEHGHAEERAGLGARGQRGVEFVRPVECGRVDDRDRIDLILIRLDPVQVRLHDHAAGGAAGDDGLPDAGDGGFDDGDGGGRRTVAGGEHKHEHGGGCRRPFARC